MELPKEETKISNNQKEMQEDLKRAAKLVMYRVNIKIAPELYDFG